MLIHTIVYAVLAILSAVAVCAFSLPISKEPRDQQETPEGDEDPNVSL
jgi:hypothetical protein